MGFMVISGLGYSFPTEKLRMSSFHLVIRSRKPKKKTVPTIIAPLLVHAFPVIQSYFISSIVFLSRWASAFEPDKPKVPLYSCITGTPQRRIPENVPEFFFRQFFPFAPSHMKDFRNGVES